MTQTCVYVRKNDDSHDIFMGDTWFLSVPTEQSIRRDDVCLKGIINMAHSIFTKGELSSMLYPLPCATYLVIHSVVNNDQHIYVIG